MEERKENVPYSDSINTLIANKMAASGTPRLPLSDLKQVARPSTDVKPKKRASLPFLQTPNTCRTKQSRRTIQPSTLVYEDDKENVKTKVDPKTDNIEVSPTGKEETKTNEDVKMIKDRKIDEFVLNVLTECVKDMEKEIFESTSDMDHHLIICTDGSDSSDKYDENAIEPKTVETNETGVSKSINMDQLETVVTNNDTEKINSTIKNLVICESSFEEEALLGNTSQDVLCDNEGFSESTKSEEELLADTPVANTLLGNQGEDLPKSVCFTVKTPKVNFFEQLAMRQRVKEATQCLESFVVHKDGSMLDLEKVMKKVSEKKPFDINNMLHKPHSDASAQCEIETISTMCSPIPVSSHDASTQNGTETQSIMCSPISIPHSDVSIQHEIETHSIMCSPMSIPHNDVSTQHELQLQSTMCSPILIPHSDVSTQHETETQSMMCSPIRVPGVDSTVQAVVETHSIMCTPIRVPGIDTSVQHVAETQSTSCSPMLLPMTDSSTQKEIESQSVLCSPMVPFPNQDKSVMVSGPESSEICIQTDEKCTFDKSVDVHPDTTTTGTEIDESPMVSCGTTMTPLKTGNKQCKKLTAEDIRKQHPRVLANEFETLKSQNSRLENQIHSLKLDSKKLISQEAQLNDLQLCKDVLEEERDSYMKLCDDWKTKFDDILMKQESLKTAHENEILTLKNDYESNDYHAHFLSSQKLVGDLQAELEQYKELLPDLHKSQSLMAELKLQYSSSFAKLKNANEILLQRKKDLDLKEEEIERWKEELSCLDDERKSIVTERRETTDKISACEKTINEMREELEKNNEELQKLQEASSDRELLFNTVKTLERTLEIRENEIDVLEKDLFECREVIYTQIEERKQFEERENTLIGGLAATKAENNDLKDCLARLRAKEQEARATVRSLEEELDGTKTHASRMIKQLGSEINDYSMSNGQLTDHMTSVLDRLKRKAGIEEITDLDLASSKEDAVEVSKPAQRKKQDSRKSFVSQILQAVGTANSNVEDDRNNENKSDTQPDLSPENQTTCNQSSDQSHLESCEDYGTCLVSASHQKLESSHGSAFAPVKVGNTVESNCINENRNVTLRTRPKGSETKIINKRVEVKTDEEPTAEQLAVIVEEQSKEENKLQNQMTKISDIFEKVIYTAQLIEKALRSSLQDLRSENYDLNRRVSQSEYSERRVSVQLDLTQNELEKCRKLIKQQQATIDNLSDQFEAVLDRQSEAEKANMERELRSLRSKIQSLEGEKEMLNDQFNELLEKVRSQSRDQPAVVDVSAQKEIIILKKKVDKYWNSACEKEELLGTEKKKAKQHAIKLEENWKRADAEVLRLYDIINKVRTKIFLSNQMEEDQDLQKILQLLDCVESDKELQPVKTAR